MIKRNNKDTKRKKRHIDITKQIKDKQKREKKSHVGKGTKVYRRYKKAISPFGRMELPSNWNFGIEFTTSSFFRQAWVGEEKKQTIFQGGGGLVENGSQAREIEGWWGSGREGWERKGERGSGRVGGRGDEGVGKREREKESARRERE